MPYIKINDLNMFYEDIGIGEPIIFIHGSLSRGITAFASQIQAFQFSNRCLYPDLRGHGNTSGGEYRWTSPQLAEDIILFMDRLNIPRAHLVGHSMGGDIAMYCAILEPRQSCP
ncbi:alpha/beta hydrolase [Brucepastera parasyntrophica]|uniref:alpha/beta fold hydrolase n=1 Tax=Brucepastera parasyntrophica TaxID=2880008 RepID=UPI00210D804C|nr:alpha/beta hydrolase [Brucepastera parasyntrophica]ULQ60497.1 alpha/beta hydrolase [Brucepastera parasyntrophica]